MAKFIEPKLKTVHRDYIGQHQNNPVNIDLCKELISTEESIGYGADYPVIKFKGCDVTWYYGKNGHEIRDEQYKELLANNT